MAMARLLRVEHFLVFGIKGSLVTYRWHIHVLGFAVLLHGTVLVSELITVVGG